MLVFEDESIVTVKMESVIVYWMSVFRCCDGESIDCRDDLVQ